MRKNLVIDIGNTRMKIAVFENGRLVSLRFNSSETSGKILTKILKHNLPTIISSVHKKLPKSKQRGNRTHVLKFTSLTPVPLKNRYRSKFTLGSDRLAAAVGGANKFPGKNVLVIDAGTCIKFNFVNAKGEYLGGSISPGIQMRFMALHNFTARLPLIRSSKQDPSLCGNTTELSIRSGVINGMVAEVEGMISAYEKKYKNLKVVITGGDGPLFDKRLKKRIFADPNLVLKGLYDILQHNYGIKSGN